MAKKRKASGRSTAPEKVQDDGSKRVRLNINSYEDVADSDDEFHINRDKVMLEEGPDAKRRRKWQEQGLSC